MWQLRELDDSYGVFEYHLKREGVGLAQAFSKKLPVAKNLSEASFCYISKSIITYSTNYLYVLIT